MFHPDVPLRCSHGISSGPLWTKSSACCTVEEATVVGAFILVGENTPSPDIRAYFAYYFVCDEGWVLLEDSTKLFYVVSFSLFSSRRYSAVEECISKHFCCIIHFQIAKPCSSRKYQETLQSFNSVF